MNVVVSESEGKRVRFALLVLMSCGAGFGFQQDAGPDPDVYAIYSLMLTNVKTSHGADTNAQYLIAAKTRAPWPGTPCVTPPAERRAEFDEVLADFETRKVRPQELKRGLSISKPYVLLDEKQVIAFIGSRSVMGSGRKASEVFPGVTDLISLSDVYFNRDRTLAMTGMSLWCGSLCGLWNWRVFEKSASGKWVERAWVTCSTIAWLRSSRSSASE
jgi:hypothetical protein